METMARYTLFTIFGRPVTAYALCIALSLAMGLWLLGREQKRRGLRADTAGIFALLSLPLGLLGARAFYCLARISFYLEIGAENMLRLFDGGYALWGAAGGAALAALMTAKITGQKCAAILDALAAPGALTIALCRFAEFFSGEGIGMYVENESFWRFPFAVCNEYGEWYWAVFLLEGAAALAIFLVLLLQKRRAAGEEAKIFLILYCACQILLESLRRDNFLRWLFVRVSQLTAVLVLAGLMMPALIPWLRRPRDRRMPPARMAARLGIFLLCIGISIWMEFAIDKSAVIPVWACYSVMAVCCIGIGCTAYQIVLRSSGTGKTGKEIAEGHFFPASAPR